MTDRIFVFCDDSSHPPKRRRVPVEHFRRLPGEGWTTDRARHIPTDGPADSGRTLVGDTMPEAGWALDPDVSNADIRVKFEMECPLCRRTPRHRRPLPARAENLFRALDDFAEEGVSEIPLAVLAAKLEKQSANEI